MGFIKNLENIDALDFCLMFLIEGIFLFNLIKILRNSLLFDPFYYWIFYVLFGILFLILILCLYPSIKYKLFFKNMKNIEKISRDITIFSGVILTISASLIGFMSLAISFLNEESKMSILAFSMLHILYLSLAFIIICFTITYLIAWIGNSEPRYCTEKENIVDPLCRNKIVSIYSKSILFVLLEITLLLSITTGGYSIFKSPLYDVEGIKIVQIDKDHAGYNAGLREGMIIHQLNETIIINEEDFNKFSITTKPQQIITVITDKGVFYVILDKKLSYSKGFFNFITKNNFIKKGSENT